MSDFSKYGGASAEWLAVEAALPTPRTGTPLESLKLSTNQGREAVSSEEMKALAPLIHTEDHAIPSRDGCSLQGRTYVLKSQCDRSNLPLVLHLHGGGHLFGTLGSEDAACARIAIATRACVFNVNYRHTPEAKYPVPWHDVEDTILWLHRESSFKFDPQQVILEGISAGAWMTASYVLAQRLGTALQNCPLIAGQILMIPCLAHDDCYAPQMEKMASPAVSSKEENKNAPILSAERVRQFLDLLDVKDPQQDDLLLNPGNAHPDQVGTLPPTVFGIAGVDPLRDEGLLYADMLKEAGVAVDVHLFKGVPHGFRRFGQQLSLSATWDKVICEGIAWILSKPSSSKPFVLEE